MKLFIQPTAELLASLQFPAKRCRHRNETGFCNKSGKQCPLIQLSKQSTTLNIAI